MELVNKVFERPCKGGHKKIQPQTQVKFSRHLFSSDELSISEVERTICILMLDLHIYRTL